MISRIQQRLGLLAAVFVLLTTLVTGMLLTQSTADADPPLAAQLLDYTLYNSSDNYNPGIRVNITNLGSNLRGLATDGTTIYAMNTSGNIVTLPLSSINMTPPQATQNFAGTVHDVGWSENGAPNLPTVNQLSISYSKGCIYMTNADNTEGNIELYCIDTSDWSVTEIEVPADKPLPVGNYFAYSNMIDFPDGRIGKVSRYTKLGDYDYQSTLRTYTITGTGKNSTITFSQDYLMSDTSTVYNDANGWARDEHGIATDGTYLYRIQWNPIVPNTKVWALESGSAGEVVYGGSYTQPFFNMHYLVHNHIDNYYMVGNYDGSNFMITEKADPGPGPGNPLTPTFGSITRTIGGFTVQITNYDSSFTWNGQTTAGSVSISNTGLVTVTGLSTEEFATVTVNTTKTGFPDGGADTTGQALDQDYLATLTSSVTGKKVVLEVDQACDIEEVSLQPVTENAVQDTGFTYPEGMIDFTADCGTPGFTTTVTQTYYDVEPAHMILRKYNPNTQQYSTINDATVTAATIDGQPATVATYHITDGGELDMDGQENGIIVDPAGLALASTPPSANNSSSSLANTGINTSIVTLIAAFLTLGGLGLLRLSLRRTTY